MRIAEMNWRQVEAWLAHDDRAVLPLGSTEQHADLSLAVDSILSERLATEAAEPLGVPVFPVLAYGITPYFTAFPGTISLRADTYLRIVRDVLDSLYAQGFRRLLVVNGHGGNAPARAAAAEFMADRADMRIRFHDWWTAPATTAKLRSIDPVASHASWMENHAWTRLAGVETREGEKPMVDLAAMGTLSPVGVRALVEDGNFGGRWHRPDADTNALWAVAVEETRALLTEGWPGAS